MTPQTLTISDEIREFVVNNFLFGQNDTGLQEEDSFLERGIIDSTGVLELTQFVEERFGITIADEELIPENLDSISNLTGFIRRKTRLE